MTEQQTPEVDVEALARAGSDAVVVDVREPAEYADGHVPHARLIPMGRLPGQLDELDRQDPVYVICASGNRSRAMTDLLRSQGFDAYSVAGGTMAWTEAGHPTEGDSK